MSDEDNSGSGDDTDDSEKEVSGEDKHDVGLKDSLDEDSVYNDGEDEDEKRVIDSDEDKGDDEQSKGACAFGFTLSPDRVIGKL